MFFIAWNFTFHEVKKKNKQSCDILEIEEVEFCGKMEKYQKLFFKKKI